MQPTQMHLRASHQNSLPLPTPSYGPSAVRRAPTAHRHRRRTLVWRVDGSKRNYAFRRFQFGVRPDVPCQPDTIDVLKSSKVHGNTLQDMLQPLALLYNSAQTLRSFSNSRSSINATLTGITPEGEQSHRALYLISCGGDSGTKMRSLLPGLTPGFSGVSKAIVLSCIKIFQNCPKRQQTI